MPQDSRIFPAISVNLGILNWRIINWSHRICETDPIGSCSMCFLKNPHYFSSEESHQYGQSELCEESIVKRVSNVECRQD